MRTTAAEPSSLLASAERDLVLVIAGLLAVYLAETYYFYGWTPKKWDVLLISGWTTFIVGLVLVQSMPAYFESVLERLLRRGVLRSKSRGRHLRNAVEARGTSWGRIGAGIAGAAILVAFIWAFFGEFTYDRGLLAFGETLGGLVAGYYLGRMCGYGSFWHVLKKQGVSIKLIPGHVDGAAGLKPLGDFYFYQAFVASLPALFTAAWLLLFPLDPGRYQNWRGPYQWLLGFGILFEAGAFVLPMLGFHRLMKKEKANCLKRADKIERELAQIERKLGAATSLQSDKAKALGERRELLAKQYQSLEQMPTWPVDRPTRKKFSLHNGFLAMPLALDIVNIHPTGAVKNLIELLQTWSKQQ